jgi:DNA-binding NtrC family response regulator
VAEGLFRQDLLYRINTVEVHLPPLRERPEDAPLLAEHFLRRYAQKYGRSHLRLTGAAMDALQAYPWPGNVRELQHAVERAVVLAEGEALGPSDFALSASPGAPATVPVLSAEPATLDLERIEREAIRRALSKHGGNISRAAAELGLTRKSLYRRIEKYGL